MRQNYRAVSILTHVSLNALLYSFFVMVLSVIIVNYNVKYFLEQCLHSVMKATAALPAEVVVVDNASTDNSVEYLKPMFPSVQFIASEKNLGFGKANNRALERCTGKYILFLNPDTLVAEDCFDKCVAFMDAQTKACALGIRMVDGSGEFLPESKRSFPSASTAFFKLIGLSSLFPKSKFFNKYSLGYLNEHQNHVVDVLAGAFMMVRKDVLDKIGAFDEAFFMYGEDIDLSYRIQKAGFENWYFADSSIIHFKGESTKKGSLNYVKMFYHAMSVFVKKHYHGSRARMFVFFIQSAIWIRAFFSWLGSFLVKIGLPILDAILIYLALSLSEKLWVQYVREGAGFIPVLVSYALPGFTLVFLSAASLAGIYDKKYKPLKAFTAAAIAIIAMLVVYSLLPEHYRFSRGVILTGGFTAALFVVFSRVLLVKSGWIEKVADENNRLAQSIIVGNEEEYNDCIQLMQRSGLEEKVLGRIKVGNDKEEAIGTLDQLQTLLTDLNIKEVIFCRGELNFAATIDLIQQLPQNISFRFHTHSSNSIIGSDSKNTSGEAVSAEGNFCIADPYQKRMKRICDVAASLLLIITFPIHLILIKNGFQSISNALKVLFAQKTWVSYSIKSTSLPKIKEGILSPNGYPLQLKQILQPSHLMKADAAYAKDYRWMYDVKLIISNYRRLGGSI
jgi:GT2 family glycosyltransferase